jgi:hypothetical protein
VKDFLEKKWWLGLGVIIATIAACVFGIPQFIENNKSETIRYMTYGDQNTTNDSLPISKPISQDTVSINTKTITSTKLVDVQHIWEIGINYSMIKNLYDQSNLLALEEYHDSKLSSFSVVVYPFRENASVCVFLYFCSAWTQRELQLLSIDYGEVKLLQNTSLFFHEPYEQLPWDQNPDWLLFLRKACEKVDLLLSHNEDTRYQITAHTKNSWSISFYDIVANQEYSFSWDGQGEPNQTK